jgi:tripartite-type tricarboxylate transporter receptor subunit TctC
MRNSKQWAGTPRRRVLATAAVCALTLASAASVDAAQTFPTKPIRVVNTVAAGGAAEVMGRIVVQKMSETWGQQIIIDSRPGAAGTIGVEIVAHAAPDGYTMLLGSSMTMVLAPLIRRSIPYNTERDFVPVGMFVISPFVLVAHPSVAAKNLNEFVALAKAKPGYFNYGSLGIGSTAHLGAEQLKMRAGIDLQHIAYKGGGPAAAALASGEVHVLFNSMGSALPFVKTGRLTLLATGGPKRSPLVPDAPTVAETYPGLEVVTAYGLLAPAKTPREIVDKVNAETRRALANRDATERLIQQGHEPFPGTPEDMKGYLQGETGKWAKFIKATGIKSDD